MAVAILGGLLGLAGLRVFFRSHFTPSPPGAGGNAARAPLAPLQKRAWWGLGITIGTLLAVVAVVLARDASFDLGILARSAGVLIGYRRL